MLPSKVFFLLGRPIRGILRKMPDSMNHKNDYKSFTYNICLEVGM